uniref:Uncharacterized protein n=1 Tax=Desulfovibrio sp. U5L TaxID=596152 RepID=I2Q1G0_9BACT
MNTDIRIAVSFKGHRKRKRLRLMLGPDSTDYLLDLWISTAMNHPTGILAGMDAVDLALEAGWEGEPEKFVQALQTCGFLDVSGDGVYSLHDWDDHQGYAIHAEKRTEKARKAALARWGTKEEDAPSMPGALPQASLSNAPSPAPSPAPLALSHPPDGERARDAVFALMSECQPKAKPKSPNKWPGMLQGLLDEGQTVEAIERTTRFALQDAFWRSRILSPKAFLDNYSQIFDQASKAEESQVPCSVEGKGQGMSAEDWEALKQKNRTQPKISDNMVNAIPP